MTISEKDFDIINDREVRHRQTGATWATYRYENPEDTGSSLTESPGRAGEGHFPTAAELRPHAVALLRRLAGVGPAKGAPGPEGWT
ncbi:hypothetical protein [Reyranella sp.]|jgi:hypothetical protein|uniref:hypothetical protein n=1 Tax=Reyranella sp. TaxID=1929291 RepID=UPI000BCCB7D7|nr:hypothetical protein [Reyranella sp.]OYY46053.1 MAG: hypothetical protein B7Y57_04155 [Rhodospirillales bacterium 35-66-84]OYZ96433.1 MAG: hypothetical protein B7Y08_04515 [Rhodospirillales bacterium 24-66-33]OZB28404.1 MAG: hypothetical protein B7X63_00630 [Rhodospirillales bacterium 39-66-50]HQS14387.1 hypothetical protein [Reyranella sp.]HQT11383.1 hypothetical protein [Reyranella sp.]